MDFEKIYDLMDTSFPDHEIRTYEDQKDLLDNERYSVFTRKEEDGEVTAFIAAWRLPSCTFLEHFAVSEKLRGKGIGSEFLKEVIENFDGKIFLEVEPPVDDIARRRIGFYERLGFKFNDFLYFQLPLRENSDIMELKVMSYPGFVNEDEFAPYKDEIHKYVYGLKK
mgnify:FL=1